MEKENVRSNSKIIWSTMREIMKDENKNISFSEVPEGYVVTPRHIRWKNFFMSNLFWPHSGEKTQKHMIALSEKINEIAKKLDFLNTDVENYIDELSNIDFSLYLTDSEKNRKTLNDQLTKENKNYAIITQQTEARIEEHATTIVAKLYFLKKGYLVGDFMIPSQFDIGYGIPDIVAIKGDFVNKLKACGIIPNGGDDSDLLIWETILENSIDANEPMETIVCEVKSSASWNQGFKQLYEDNGYLKSKCFNKAYVCFGMHSETGEKIPRAIHEAGALIFTDNTQPIVFREDPIFSNPSSSRRAPSVQVNKNRQVELIDRANYQCARIMAGGLLANKIIPNIGNLTIYQIFKQIKDIRVENVLEQIMTVQK